VIVTTDPTDPTGNEVSVPGILILHEDAVATEYGRSAVALDDSLIGKVNFRKDAQTSNYPGDRIPRHFNDIFWMGWGFL
jgi:hypothetical protein